MVGAEVFTIIAAFLSGVGSVLTGLLAIRFERRRSMEECEQRIEAFREGMRIREELERDRRDDA